MIDHWLRGAGAGPKKPRCSKYRGCWASPFLSPSPSLQSAACNRICHARVPPTTPKPLLTMTDLSALTTSQYLAFLHFCATLLSQTHSLSIFSPRHHVTDSRARALAGQASRPLSASTSITTLPTGFPWIQRPFIGCNAYFMSAPLVNRLAEPASTSIEPPLWCSIDDPSNLAGDVPCCLLPAPDTVAVVGKG